MHGLGQRAVVFDRRREITSGAVDVARQSSKYAAIRQGDRLVATTLAAQLPIALDSLEARVECGVVPQLLCLGPDG